MCCIWLLITPSMRCISELLWLCECDCIALATPTAQATPIFFLAVGGMISCSYFLVRAWKPHAATGPTGFGRCEGRAGGYSTVLAFGLWALLPPSVLPAHKRIWEVYSRRSRLVEGMCVCAWACWLFLFACAFIPLSFVRLVCGCVFFIFCIKHLAYSRAWYGEKN